METEKCPSLRELLRTRAQALDDRAQQRPSHSPADASEMHVTEMDWMVAQLRFDTVMEQSPIYIGVDGADIWCAGCDLLDRGLEALVNCAAPDLVGRELPVAE